MKVQAEIEGTTERVHMNSDLPVMEGTNVEKLQGDARDYLNGIRAGQIGKDLPNKDDKQGLDTAKENVVDQQVLQIEGGKQSVCLRNQNVNNTGFKEITVGDVAKLDKGPTKPSRDVPASIALARISNVVNPIVHAYNNMASKETIFSSGVVDKDDRSSREHTSLSRKIVDSPTELIVTAEDTPNATTVTQVIMQQQTLNVQAGVHATLNDIAKPRKNAAATDGSNLNATVALISQADNFPSVTRQLDTRRIQSNSQQILGEKLVAFVGIPDGVKASKTNVELLGSNLEEAGTSRAVADRATAGVIKTTASPITRQLDTRRIQSNSQQILGEKLVAFVGIPDGVKASKTNVELLGSNLEEAGTSRAVADRATAGVIKTTASPSKNNISVHKTKTNETNNVTVSNSFEALMNEQDLEDVWKEGQQVQHETNIKPRQSSATRKQQQQSIPSSNSGKPVQGSGNVTKDRVFDEVTLKHELVEILGVRRKRIIKNAQNEMMMNSTLVKQPLVTLNTSVFDVLSQSVESFGDFEGESGQIMLSTGNNNEVIQSNLRLMAIKSKLWQEQCEDDDEEDWGDGFAGYSSEDADKEVNHDSAGSYSNSGMQNAATGSPSVTVQQQQIDSNSSNTNPTCDRTTTVQPKSGHLQGVITSTYTTPPTTKNQTVTTVPVISEEERKLLDEIVSSTSLNPVNLNAYSTGPVTKSRNKMQKTDQHQSKAMVTNTKGQSALVTLDIVQNAPQSVNVGREIFEEG
uniref:Enolase-phosphatase E1-like n=1 Tax=Nicotiana sylvestris TaxID=4096 RepID=A0A1U7WP80_NICSY|nr:PREDICTED: enolase-phosphatase E1-like [Nicotiana sylvestris]